MAVGDLNVKPGCELPRTVMGKDGLGNSNDMMGGLCLCNFHHLVIGDIFFEHKAFHKASRVSTNDFERNHHLMFAWLHLRVVGEL